MTVLWVVLAIVASVALVGAGFTVGSTHRQSKIGPVLLESYELGFHLGELKGNVDGYSDGYQDGVNTHHRDTK